MTGRVYFSFAPSRHSPLAPLAPSHSRFENSKHINSDWVRVWRYTGFIIYNYLAVPQKLQSTISRSCFVAVTLVCILTVIVLLYLSLIKGFPNCCNQVWLKFGTLFKTSFSNCYVIVGELATALKQQTHPCVYLFRLLTALYFLEYFYQSLNARFNKSRETWTLVTKRRARNQEKHPPALAIFVACARSAHSFGLL